MSYLSLLRLLLPQVNFSYKTTFSLDHFIGEPGESCFSRCQRQVDQLWVQKTISELCDFSNYMESKSKCKQENLLSKL